MVVDSSMASLASSTDTVGLPLGPQSSSYSCRIGHNESFPVCAICDDDDVSSHPNRDEYAGGSTSLCNHCDAAKTGSTIGVFVLAAVFAYLAFFWLPKVI
eukprot:COSAG06_NODE_4656_length_4061_cov_2.726653_1_plen_99_part_10